MQNFLERHFQKTIKILKRMAKRARASILKNKNPKLKLLFLTDRVEVSLLTLFVDNF